MTITVSAGVTRSGLNITGGDPLVVLSLGAVQFSTVLSGGSATLDAGATGAFLVVSKGGTLQGAGVISGDNIDAGSISGVLIDEFGYLDVVSGGSVSGVAALDSSTILIEPGASASGAEVIYGGVMDVLGSAADSFVAISGAEIVYAGARVSGDTIGNAGLLVLAGGIATDETVTSGGTLDFEGALKSNFTAGPVTATTTLSGVTVSSGGAIRLVAATVESGVTLSLAAAAAVGGALTIASGGLLRGPGAVDGADLVAGSASGVTLAIGADVTILSGGHASGLTVSGDSELLVNAGGIATGTVVADGLFDVYGSAAGGQVAGEEFIEPGGFASGDTVQSNAFLILSHGGTASDESVRSGGTVDYGGDIAADLTLAGGPQTSKTVLSGVTVNSGGYIDLEDPTVLSGVTLDLEAGVSAYGLTVSSGGVALGAGELEGAITDAGQVTATTLVGGDLTLLSGGTLAATVVSSGGAVEAYGGVLSGDTISSGGRDVIRSGGLASGVTVLAGGVEYVLSGGTTTGTTVDNGGQEFVSSGGEVRAIALLAGATLLDDGEVRMSGAGELAGTLTGSGLIAQTASGSLVLSGSDAAFSGAAVIEAGTIELATSAALGTGYAQFEAPASGTAVLQIDAADAPAAGGTFANTILNFSAAGEDIDLRSIAYVSGASATVSGGVLVLSDGGNVYKFKLAGTTAGAYPVTSDGHGGTLIDPKALAFTHSLAAFAPSDAAKTALVSSTSPAGQTPFAHAAASAGHG